MDPPLAKAEPIRDTSSASVIAYLRKCAKCHAANVKQERENVRETALQTSRSVKQEREEVFQAPEQRFPCCLWRRPW